MHAHKVKPKDCWNGMMPIHRSGLPCRGKVIVRHENHPMGTEATLIYNLWIFSWLINLIRRLMGIVFGFGGRVLYMALETYHGQVTPQLPTVFLQSMSQEYCMC